ncbi:hypothetical protein Nepgr_005550 [Nepenthes gracilis]|uniref:Uncharacterized protein n=1 Tax=Nepenthes gracilis TaxID=150966 RepID=A0AAD3S3Q6_NEPGR|nr:hypothetical protein Nepgr_005550 [Nepenthes gracilis]
MTVGDNSSDNAVSMPKNNGRDPFDIFGSDSETPLKQENHDDNLRSLMAGLSISGNASGAFPETIFPNSIDSRNGRLDSQTSVTNANAVFAMDAIPYAIPPGIMSNQLYCSQSINYGAMGSFHDQQQFRAAMANCLPLASFYPQNAGVDYADGTSRGYSSPLPDIFHTSMPTRANSTILNNSKETKAFDFISDHIAAARDTKRIA